MKKDFKKWHLKKETLNDEKNRPFFREAEVWFCSIGVNVGFEQDGAGGNFLRPVVVIKKFNNEVFWALPLTKRKKKGPYYFSFKLNSKISTAILSQVRLIDSKRLYYKIGVLTVEELKTIRKCLMQFLT
jgi:mRNA-degrading endonuclease toxin of MazEF toxin-antitoxin module